KGSVPPLWSFGYWQSKISYTSAAETLDIARNMRQHNIPLDVLHLDTHWFEKDWYCNLEFCKERFPDVDAYLDEMGKLGVKISLWQLPYIPEGSRLFDEIKNANGFVKNKDGGIYDLGLCFTPGFKGIVGVVDFTCPDGVGIYLDAIKGLLKRGVRAIKTDFGESAPIDGIYHDGTPGEQMHNLYPLLYNKAVFEATCETLGEKEGMVWARSAWAGGQRYPVHWGGDNSPNYFNLVPQFAGGLSMGLSGFQFWSQDIGGFLGDTSGRLLIRWMQAAMFMSHSRIHGSGDRELYKFDNETMTICRSFIQLRYRLMPYIYAMAVKCVKDSLPMMRPLVVEYQYDPNVATIDSQWLFGESILVAPICDDGDTRRVYLPGGVWTCWWSGERILGNQWVDAKADIAKIPLYIREGAIIPFGPDMQFIGEKETNSLVIKVAVFEQDGVNCLEVPLGSKTVVVEYMCKNGVHTVKVDDAGVDVKIEQYCYDNDNLKPDDYGVYTWEIVKAN
ncbi:MAG: glycoside hydrolase family 31 protein, partial [Defluviitaleaceae bacterium]|nr:glycoside hydrolase family 31 protein [Defluviitaleaceae bacterium]